MGPGKTSKGRAVKNLFESIWRRAISRIFGGHTGYLDGITEDGKVVGWARSDPNVPVVISVAYNGQQCPSVVADLYRADLEAAGHGSGRHGFAFPLPCAASKFDPALLHVGFGDGTPLPFGRFFDEWKKVDLLRSGVTRHVNLEFTTRCNLRCAYCAVSLPGYVGRDLDLSDIDYLIEQLKDRKVQIINVNGHGETTFVADWHRRIDSLMDAGFGISIITNLARLLREEELATMARMHMVTVSIDTHEPLLLRQVRRHVKLENILTNMRAISRTAADLAIPEPRFVWSCVISDKTAMTIADYTRFGISNGVKDYQICNLVEHEGFSEPDAPKSPLTLPPDQLSHFACLLSEAKETIRRAGGSISIGGDLEELTRFASKGVHA